MRFSQAATGEALSGTDGVTHAKTNCCNCNARGHYSGSCTSTYKRANVVTSLQVGVFFTQCFPSAEDIIDLTRIILYSASTVTTVNNKALLSNIWDCTEDEMLLFHTNGRDKIFHQQGDLNIVSMTAHYDLTSLTNILSMKDVQNIPGICITMDTLEESAMLIHLSDKNVLKL